MPGLSSLFGRDRKAATRVIPTEEPEPKPEPLPASTEQKTSPFDPTTRISTLITDPLYHAIHNQWLDRQSRGRIDLEACLRHPEVKSSFELRLNFIKAHMPHMKPRAANPTPKQKEIADFSNYIIQSLNWGKFVDGVVGHGFEFGFSLSEVVTTVKKVLGRNYIVLDKLALLPQASLDHGFIPRHEFGELALHSDPRYRCFEFDGHGRIEAVYQYYHQAPNDRIEWRGRDLQRIMHYTHKGGDGNPWGESALFSTWYAWADLYSLEQLENVFLDTALPWMLVTYKTEDGQSRPAVHSEIINIIKEQGPAALNRFIIAPDARIESAAPSNENFTKHVTLKKNEQRKYIRKTLLVPESLLAEADVSEGDARNLVQVYFKYTLKADLAEVGSFVEELARRLIDANYKALDEDDYPEATWTVITENELRVAQSMLATLMPHVDSDKLGTVANRFVSGFDSDFIAEKHTDSVGVKRPLRDSNDEPNTNLPGSTPPPKEPGEQRQRLDSQTSNPSTDINTEA